MINNMTISSQASSEEGSETIRKEYAVSAAEAPSPDKGDDIVQSLEKSKAVSKQYTLYYIVSNLTNSYYIGITSKTPRLRWNDHKSSCNRGIKNKLYDCMREYGIENFMLVIVDKYDSHKECCEAEIKSIRVARERGHNILNIADGGEGGFNVRDLESWRLKISQARAGRKPSLGMKHTDESKKKMSEASLKRWDNEGRYPVEVCRMPFKEANMSFGISRTHYYHMKRALSNDQC